MGIPNGLNRYINLIVFVDFLHKSIEFVTNIEFFKKRYMTLYQFSGSIFWYTVSTAISKSKTHPKGEVNIALKELDAKYG